MKTIKLYLLTLFCIFSFIPLLTSAQENRSYKILSFDETIGIYKNSTVDIVENITYDFVGEYHKGWRAVSHKGIGAIT